MFKKFLTLRENESRGAKAHVSQAAHEFDVESLEDRRMLAVMVNVSGNNNVTITSDNAADAILVTNVGGIVGVFGTGGAPGLTGVAAPTLNNLTINMGGGTDIVLIDGDFGVGRLQVAGNLTINMGGGNTPDAVFIGDGEPLLGFPFDQGVNVLGNLHVTTGNGADIVSIDETDVTGSTYISTCGGTDVVGIGLFNAAGLGPLGNNFLGRLTVNTGADGDVAFLNDSFVGANLNVQAGGGDDFMFIGSAFGALPGFGLTVNGNVTVNGGGGADLASVDNLAAIGGSLCIHGGGGDDVFAVGTFGGPGNVTAAGDIRVLMNTGNDTLAYNTADVFAPLPNRVILNGGGGNGDTLIVFPALPLLNQEEVFSFETVI